MITSVEIENLRGIARGAVADLAPLSVLVGPNNSGKSTILEALYLDSGGGNAHVAAELARRRGWCGLECVVQLAYREGSAVRVTVQRGDDQKVNTVELTHVSREQLDREQVELAARSTSTRSTSWRV